MIIIRLTCHRMQRKTCATVVTFDAFVADLSNLACTGVSKGVAHMLQSVRNPGGQASKLTFTFIPLLLHLEAPDANLQFAALVGSSLPPDRARVLSAIQANPSKG